MGQQVNELVNQPFLGAEAESLPFGGGRAANRKTPNKKGTESGGKTFGWPSAICLGEHLWNAVSLSSPWAEPPPQFLLLAL
jgi:hypothetical protein